MTPKQTIDEESLRWLSDEIIIIIKSIKLKLELASDAEAVAILSVGISNMVAIVTKQGGLSKEKADSFIDGIIDNMRENYEAQWKR